MSLFIYAPVCGILLAIGLREAAVAGAVVVVGGAVVPDLDQRVPGVTHRGITHTTWFALATGAVLGVIGGLAAGAGGAVFGFAVGVLTIGAHLLGDVLTPAGIRPFAPVRHDEYSLKMTKAANPVANYPLLALGAVAAGAVLLLTGPQ